MPRINLRAIDAASVGISLDETTTRDDVVALAGVFGATIDDIDALDRRRRRRAARRRCSRSRAFLAHPVFNTHHSEHEMLRYMRIAGRQGPGAWTAP